MTRCRRPDDDIGGHERRRPSVRGVDSIAMITRTKPVLGTPRPCPAQNDARHGLREPISIRGFCVAVGITGTRIRTGRPRSRRLLSPTRALCCSAGAWNRPTGASTNYIRMNDALHALLAASVTRPTTTAPRPLERGASKGPIPYFYPRPCDHLISIVFV